MSGQKKIILVYPFLNPSILKIQELVGQYEEKEWNSYNCWCPGVWKGGHYLYLQVTNYLK